MASHLVLVFVSNMNFKVIVSGIERIAPMRPRRLTRISAIKIQPVLRVKLSPHQPGFNNISNYKPDKDISCNHKQGSAWTYLDQSKEGSGNGR